MSTEYKNAFWNGTLMLAGPPLPAGLQRLRETIPDDTAPRFNPVPRRVSLVPPSLRSASKRSHR